MVNHEMLRGSRLVYRGRRVSLRVDTIELPSGRTTTREIVEFNNCVAIVAIDSAGNVILVRQYRTATGKVLMEIPAGKIEDNEHPLKCAHRELKEETGYSARMMTELGGFYAAPGYSTEYLHLFLATHLNDTGVTPDGDEIMDVFSIPLTEIPELIANGTICDLKSIAGLLRVISEGLPESTV